MKTCYATGLQKTPTLSGRIYPAVTIEVDGKVTVKTLASTIDDAAVVDCVVGVLQKTAFEKPSAVVRVVPHITFTPGKTVAKVAK